MQQGQIPIPPAVIVSMILLLAVTPTLDVTSFSSQLFHMDIERPICGARSMGVPACTSTFAFYFLLPYFTIYCEIMLSPQYNFVT
jgi:hypothetical protein